MKNYCRRPNKLTLRGGGICWLAWLPTDVPWHGRVLVNSALYSLFRHRRFGKPKAATEATQPSRWTHKDGRAVAIVLITLNHDLSLSPVAKRLPQIAMLIDIKII